MYIPGRYIILEVYKMISIRDNYRTPSVSTPAYY